MLSFDLLVCFLAYILKSADFLKTGAEGVPFLEVIPFLFFGYPRVFKGSCFNIQYCLSFSVVRKLGQERVKSPSTLSLEQTGIFRIKNTTVLSGSLVWTRHPPQQNIWHYFGESPFRTRVVLVFDNYQVYFRFNC